MPSFDLEIVRAMFAAWERRDLDGMLEFVSPHVHWEPSAPSAGERFYVGHEGLRRWAAQFEGPGREIRVRAEQVAHLEPGQVEVLGTVSTRSADGAEVVHELRWVFELLDGKVIHGRGQLIES